MKPNAVAQYQKVQGYVDESDKGLLLLKVLNRIVEKLDHAAAFMDKGDYEGRQQEISQVRQTIEVLIEAVDMSYGEISQNLVSLYVYIQKRLTDADVKNDKDLLAECRHLITTIHEGFHEAYQREKKAALEKVAVEKSGAAGYGRAAGASVMGSVVLRYA